MKNTSIANLLGLTVGSRGIVFTYEGRRFSISKNASCETLYTRWADLSRNVDSTSASVVLDLARALKHAYRPNQQCGLNQAAAEAIIADAKANLVNLGEPTP